MSRWKENALLLIAAAAVVGLPLGLQSGPSAAYVSRPPIVINSNADFTPVGAGFGCECVANGTGMPFDPYVIEGWEVDASIAHGVFIQNTDASFVIRAVYVHSGGTVYDGIHLLAVQNGTIEDSTLSGNRDGIRAVGRNLTIANNTVSLNTDEGIFVGSAGGPPNANTVVGNTVTSNTWSGINLNDCSYVTVAGNVVRSNGAFGIWLWYSDHVNVTGNNASFNRNAGVSVGHSTDVFVSGNSLYRNLNGIGVGYGGRTTVANNTVASSDYSGIAFYTSNEVLVTGNTIVGNPSVGIGLDVDVTGARLDHNAFFANGVQADDRTGAGTAWDDGYPSGGNYWSDHAGADDCSGPLQDVCPDPDRIIDSSYVIDGNSQDRYPLVAPLEYVPPRAPRLVGATLTGGGLEDLTLAWSRASDEGLLGGTVAYRVLMSVGSALGPFMGIATVPANGSATYEYVCAACGHVPGDTDLRFFRIQSVDVWENAAVSGLGARYTKVVVAGMNLLTVPVRGSDPSLALILQTVWPAVASIRTYDGEDPGDPWKSFSAAKGGGDLVALPFGTAYWVDSSTPGQYTIAGLIEDSPSFALHTAWNLVSYASVMQEDMAASTVGLAVRRVETFDASSDPYRLRAVPPEEVLVWGEGYWVYVDADGLWSQG